MLKLEVTVTDSEPVDATFIAGNSLNGTTTLDRTLGQSPFSHTLSEIHFFEEPWSVEADTLMKDLIM